MGMFDKHQCEKCRSQVKEKDFDKQIGICLVCKGEELRQVEKLIELLDTFKDLISWSVKENDEKMVLTNYKGLLDALYMYKYRFAHRGYIEQDVDELILQAMRDFAEMD